MTMSGYPPLFLLNNRSMMGFGTYETTIFQIAKELIDNSIDSVRLLEAKEKERNVEFSLEVQDWKSGNHDLIRIECTDSGVGISFPLSDAMKAFGTSKISTHRDLCGILDGDRGDEAKEVNMNEDEDRTDCTPDDGNAIIPPCGKFGVGLSACLLFSSIDNNSSFPLTVFTKTVESEHVKMANFSVSRTKVPVLLDHKEEHASGDRALSHGTRIALFARMPTAAGTKEGNTEEGDVTNPCLDGLDRATMRIENYIRRVKILSGDLSITLKVSDPVRGTRVLVGEGSSTVSPEDLAGRIVQWSKSQTDASQSAVNSTAIIGERHLVKVSPDLSFTCSAVLICDVISSDITRGSHSDASQSKSVPFKLLRYFNSSPVLSDGGCPANQGQAEEGAVATARGHCDVEKAVFCGLKWNTIGCRLDYSAQSCHVAQAAERSLEQELLRMNISSDIAPFQSASSGPDLGTPVIVREMLLILDSQGDLPYADMQKCALTFAGHPTARNACIKAAISSINKLRQEIVGRSTSAISSPFLATKKEYHDYTLHCQAVPSIANSMARMLHSSSVSADNLYRTMALLGLGQTSSHSDHLQPAVTSPPLSLALTRGRLETLLHMSLEGTRENEETAIASADIVDQHQDQDRGDDGQEEWI